jgi:hypothetical protein
MRRAKPNAGLVEFLFNLRKVSVEIMLGELKFEFTLMRFFGDAHNLTIGIARSLIPSTESVDDLVGMGRPALRSMKV